jgi:hypothetical protein
VRELPKKAAEIENEARNSDNEFGIFSDIKKGDVKSMDETAKPCYGTVNFERRTHRRSISTCR